MSDAMNFDHLVELCRLTHEEMQKQAVRAVDLTLVVRNWLFGRYIVEYEQNGADRAAYGAGLMEALTSRLKPFGIKGVSATRLRLYRSFYREYEAIQPTPSGELAKSALSSGIQPTPSVELAPTHQTAAELIKSVENLIRRFPTEGQVMEKAADLLPAPTVRSKKAAHRLPAPTVRPKQAQGTALGDNPKMIQALKGRPNPCLNRSPVFTSISSSAPRIVNDSSSAISAILSMPTGQPSCKIGAVPRCSSILSKTMFTSCSIWHAPSPSAPRSRRSKKPRQNGSRRRAQRLLVSLGRPDMARLPYPSPTFQPCGITSPDNKSITGRSHSKTNTEPSWCDTELISMNDTSGINVSPWAAPSGLHSFSSARPRALPWPGMVCPVGALEVARLEQITHDLEGGEPL